MTWHWVKVLVLALRWRGLVLGLHQQLLVLVLVMENFLKSWSWSSGRVGLVFLRRQLLSKSKTSAVNHEYHSTDWNERSITKRIHQLKRTGSFAYDTVSTDRQISTLIPVSPVCLNVCTSQTASSSASARQHTDGTRTRVKPSSV